MDESKTSSNGPAPFLTKTYEMVDDPVTNSLVSWSQSGYSFVVWNPPDFATDLLPKYFKHNNFSSFVRQLNTYGFRKIDPEQWEFANEEFIRGRTHLLKNMYRRKPVHSHSALNQVTENERNEFEGKIERLKKDKTLLQLELKRRESENQGLEFQVQRLCERLQNLECRQMQLMNLFAKLLKKPGFAFAVMQQSQVDSKRRRLLKPSYDQKVLSLEQIDKLESSLNFWASFVYGIGEVFSEEVYDFGVLPQLCIGVTEEDVSYKEPCSPTSHLYSTHSTPAEPASASASASSVPTKVNDVFWEQLLMEETPDSANTKETFL